MRNPWDNLSICSCGGLPFMKGESGVFSTGYPYQIICLKCGKSTKKGTVPEIRKEWNSMGKE